MRPLRFSINVTLNGCYDHTAGIADADLHRNAMEYIAGCDALLLGRVTYGMMEEAWRLPPSVSSSLASLSLFLGSMPLTVLRTASAGARSSISA